MPTFIEKSCCKGNRPTGVVGLHHKIRPDIIGAMLRDRHVARYLVAPKGYGKSSCAYEYAQVVFEFKHVFWIRCDSPCFLRDLDAGTIAAQVEKADANAALVVLDDVPHLDQARSEALNAFVERMLDAECEVVVACIPSVDTFSAMQMDRIVLDGRALLLSDDEVEAERLRGNMSRSAAASLPSSERAACMLWGEGGAAQMLKGIAEEELPGELELAMFCMLALSSGTLEELPAVLVEARVQEDAAYLASMYPYLGIDVDSGTFRCVDADVSDVVALSGFSPAALSRASVQRDREGFCFALADMLMEKGEGDRAACLVLSFSSRASAAKWVAANGWRLLSDCQPLAVERLLGAHVQAEGGQLCGLLAMQAWALALLDDAEGSGKACRRVERSACARWQDAAAAALSQKVFGGVSSGDGGDARLAQALKARESSGADDASDGATRAGGGASEGATRADGGEGMFDWEAFARLELARSRGAEEFLEAFARALGAGAGADAGAGEVGAVGKGEAPAASETALAPPMADDGLRGALLASCAWFLEDAVARCRAREEVRGGEPLEGAPCEGASPTVAFLSGELEGRPGAGSLSWPECLAASALQDAIEAWPFAFERGISPKTVAASRNVAISLLVQSEKHRHALDAENAAKDQYRLTHEDPLRATPRPSAKVASLRVSTPSLLLSLFGGLEAWIGSDKSDPRQIRRKNAKVVLALLAVNRGREVTKERMASTLWPDADPSVSRQNLYVVWAYLKKALSVGGSCPYLVSTQTGYKFDCRYVSSDIDAFDELCKGLLFGRNDKELWEEMYEKVSADFSEDLLPEVKGSEYVDGVRERYRTQLVDGLVEASSRMWREGENRGAVWFAREALRRDCSREDAYIALMEAQIASSQRGAALDTYFECRRFLSERLGIDPSRRVIELYRSVIETEEEF